MSVQVSIDSYIIDRDNLLQWGNSASYQTQIGRYFLLAMFLKEEKVKNIFFS